MHLLPQFLYFSCVTKQITRIAVNKSGLKPDLTIQYTSSKDSLGHPFPAYAEIIMFQTTSSSSDIFSNNILASSRLPNFAYIDNNVVFTISSSHKLLRIITTWSDENPKTVQIQGPMTRSRTKQSVNTLQQMISAILNKAQVENDEGLEALPRILIVAEGPN